MFEDIPCTRKRIHFSVPN